MASNAQLADVLSEFARTMLTDFPIQAILDHLVGRIVEVLPVSAAGVTLIAPPAAPRYIAASNGSALRWEQLQTRVGEGPCLAAYRTGEAVSVPDLANDERFEPFVKPARDLGLAAAFTFPLHHGDRRLGALDLYRDTPGALGAEDLITAQTLADVTAAYLVNAQARADLEDSSERSHARAVHDPLTGLPNRTLLLERLRHAARRNRRSSNILALLFLDLDDFKAVNDVHGHQAGDELLVAVAHRVNAELRPGDTLARLSGDEFVILCEELDTEAEATLVGRRVLAAFGQPFNVAGVEIPVTASVGIAFAGQGDHVPDQLLHDADIAMYQAKRRGGASMQVIDLREQRRGTHGRSLAHDLRAAIAQGQLRAAYQPIVYAGSGRISGAEALLRWDHPLEGPIAPAVLIPLAEQSGQILAVGRWILERACADRNAWGVHDGCRIAVNVSSNQLMAPDFVREVADVLSATGTPPEFVTLELTESVFIRDAERALGVLSELKGLGVQLALDDFGTGYSSLSYLRRFPVDIVKIDRSFIVAMQRDPGSHAIVATVIDLAHLLGLAVVAEGVETAEQRDDVLHMGADSCQGFYFGRPMASEQLAVLVGRNGN